MNNYSANGHFEMVQKEHYLRMTNVHNAPQEK